MGGEGANRDVATESVAAVAHSNKDTSPSFGFIAKAVHAVISLQSQARKLFATRVHTLTGHAPGLLHHAGTNAKARGGGGVKSAFC